MMPDGFLYHENLDPLTQESFSWFPNLYFCAEFFRKNSLDKFS